MEHQSDDIAGLLVESATAFITENYGSRHPRFDIETPQKVDRTLWGEMADLGWLGLALPETLDGLGMGMREAALLAEAMGRQAVPEPFVAAAIMPSVLLGHCDPSSPVARRLAETTAGGEALVTLAWQEAAGEFDTGLPATRLEANSLTGSKCFVPAVEDDSLLLVTALDGDQLAIVGVAADAPGLSYRRHAGGSMSFAEVAFDATPILDGAVLLRGATAEAALRAAIEAGRVTASAQLCGIAEGVLEKTVAYVNERHQFDRPIGSFQAIQHRCVDHKVANLMAGAAWRNAQRAFDAAPLSPETQAAISAAKARCGDAAMAACKGAVQMHGAMGFTEEGGVGIYLRAAMQFANWLGNATAHRRRFLAKTA